VSLPTYLDGHKDIPWDQNVDGVPANSTAGRKLRSVTVPCAVYNNTVVALCVPCCCCWRLYMLVVLLLVHLLSLWWFCSMVTTSDQSTLHAIQFETVDCSVQ